jgi:hypothetical protein
LETDPSLKDNSQKTYRDEDEIKTKIREGKRKNFCNSSYQINCIGKMAKYPIIPCSFRAQKETNGIPRNIPIRLEKEKSRQVTENVKSDLQESKLQNDQPQSLFAPKPSTSGIPDVKPPLPEKVPSGLIAWIALLLTIILFSIIGYFTYSLVNDLNRKVEELESKLTSLRSELATSTAFVNKYISLIEFLTIRMYCWLIYRQQIQTNKHRQEFFWLLTKKKDWLSLKMFKALQPNQGYHYGLLQGINLIQWEYIRQTEMNT